MPRGQVLEFSGITKRFGSVTAVEGLSARIEPGLVTGFLGPNGAGKTTTLRMLLGLVRPTSGRATIGGVPYAQLRRPLQSVGAVLEASSFHPGRTAAHHLAVYADAVSVPRARVDEVLATVGLADVAGRKVGGFSLGMQQRLGLAYALLGDPGVLVLDEPANGLDPEGIRWMRSLLRTLAGEGRTVLVSSHLLAEVQQTVDALLIIAGGRLVFSGGIEDLADPADVATVVDAPDRAALVSALEAEGLTFETLRNGLTVRTAEPAEIGAIAAAAGVALSTLQRKGAGLEEVFLELVSGARVHPSAGGVGGAVAAEAAVVPASADTAPTERADAEGPVPGDSPVLAPADAEADAVADEAETGDAGAATTPETETRDASADATPDAGAAPAEVAEPPTSPASFSVASTGVIDIVVVHEPRDDAEGQDEPATAGEAGTSADEEAWLADISPIDPAGDEGEIASPDDDGGYAPETAPQEQPVQPESLTWSAEPITPEGGAADAAEPEGDAEPREEDGR